MRQPTKNQHPWHLLFIGIAIITAGIVAIIAVGPVFAWSYTYSCGPEGVTGTITVGDTNQPFTVSLEDHVPGDAQFKPVPGSGQVLNPPFVNPVSYGPLSDTNVRPNANSIRVVNSLTNEKSESFPPCTNTPTSTPSPSVTPTVTPSPTPGPTATPTTTPSPRPKETAEPRPTPSSSPSATPTPTTPIVTPTTSLSPTPTPGSLPDTGGMPNGRTLPSEPLIVLIIGIVLFAWYRVLKGSK